MLWPSPYWSWPAASFREPMNGGEGWRVDALTSAQEIALVLDPNEVLEDHLRSPNGAAELDYAARLIRVAQEEAQQFTQLAIGEQEFALVLDRVAGLTELELPFPPVTAVTSVVYTDGDGVSQSWDGSPPPYDVSLPTGPRPRRARVRPASGGSWPTTGSGMDVVRVEYTAGFTDQTVPGLITTGMLLLIGELYKQRSESVHAPNQSAAIVRARNLWSRLKVY